MLKRVKFCMSLLLAMLVFSTGAAAQGVVENPAFKNWENFSVGSSATYTSITVASGAQTHQEYTLTLVGLTDQKAEVERRLSVVMPDGTRMTYPAMTSNNPRTYKLRKGMKLADPENPDGVTEKGEEEVEVADTKVKAKWVKMEAKVEAGTTYSQTWFSKDIPGGLLKSVNKTPATDSVTTVTLIEMKLVEQK